MPEELTLRDYFERVILMEEKFLKEHEAHYVDLLKERDRRYETQFYSLDKRRQASIESIEKAVDKAAIAQERSDAKNNEFRAQLTEERATYATKSEIEQRFTALASEFNQRFVSLEKQAENNRTEIAGLRESRSQAAGNDVHVMMAKSDRTWSLGMTIAIISSAAALLLTIAGIMLRK